MLDTNVHVDINAKDTEDYSTLGISSDYHNYDVSISGHGEILDTIINKMYKSILVILTEESNKNIDRYLKRERILHLKVKNIMFLLELKNNLNLNGGNSYEEVINILKTTHHS